MYSKPTVRRVGLAATLHLAPLSASENTPFDSPRPSATATTRRNSRRATGQRAFFARVPSRTRMPVALAANAASLAPSTLCHALLPALGRLDSRAHWTPSLVRMLFGQYYHCWLFHAPRARESPARNLATKVARLERGAARPAKGSSLPTAFRPSPTAVQSSAKQSDRPAAADGRSVGTSGQPRPASVRSPSLALGVPRHRAPSRDLALAVCA